MNKKVLIAIAGALALLVRTNSQAQTITSWTFDNLAIGQNQSPAPSFGLGLATPLGMSNTYNGVANQTTNFCDVLSDPGSSDASGPNSWRVRGGWNGANPPNAFIDLNAGKDINATDSGIIGGNLQLTAGGKINGILVGTGTINVNSQSSVNVTAFGGGGVNISAVGTVSGTVISGGSVSVSGQSITANLIAQTVSTSGNSAEATVGVPQSNVAREDSKAAEDAATSLAKADESGGGDDDKKKKDKTITLAQKSGRVTVLLRENQ